MLVKIIKNGVESEWFELTKKRHRTLLKDAPDAVIFLIDDLYPNSPDSGTYVTLDFSRFAVLARDFVLEENRQLKRIERNHDKRALDEIGVKDVQSRLMTMEDRHLHKELVKRLELAKRSLTPTQHRRLKLYIEDGRSLREIASVEGVHNTAIEDSIRAALKKLKKYLN